MKKKLTGYYCFTHNHDWSIIESFNKNLVIARCKNCGKEEVIFINGDRGFYFNWMPPDDKIIFI